MREPVFVTGGSGFVGGAVLRELTSAGYEVRALARGPSAADRVEAAGAAVVRGDLFDPGALLRGMRGCHTVFHIAGMYSACVSDPSEMMRTNVAGSVAVLRAAAAAGVERFAHTSSASTIGERRGEVGDEASIHRGWFLSQYERSKTLAERRVLEMGPALGVEVISVNPSSVQGPGRADGPARALCAVLRRRWAVVPQTWLSFVDVEDCARGHVLAASQGRPGSRYVLSAASLSTDEAVALLRQICGAPRHTIRPPRAVVTGAAAVSGLAGRVSRRPWPWCPEVGRTILHGHRYDGSRAERELGLRYRPPEESLRRTIAWLHERGLIGPLPRAEGAT